jgi:class 3 adenylate cyclase/tetratricopeptide (TPR) repeat protein
MLCANCRTDNATGSRFCNQCAAPLGKRCPKCSFDSSHEARFCARCAAPLDALEPINAQSEAVERPAGERRHLTVLFCDLVGSTAIAARLDPEEWRETLAGFHRTAAEAITRFDGHVAKNLGDGVMAYFGWPAAHDNDAERAARAGLAILDAIARLNEQPGHAKLAVRNGIDSGLVVIGKGAGQDAEVFGETPNIAARVEAAAEPGTIVISDAAHRLVSGLFVVEDLGLRALKGIEQPLQLYRVVRPSGVRGRFQAASAAGGLTSFVGREDELRLLTSRWERALDGEGQVALIVGEAGIGKSRLLQRFHEQIAGTPHTWVEAGAGAFFQNTPFYPVSEILQQFLGEVPTQDQIAGLERRLTAAGLKPSEAIPLLAPLLSLPLPAEYPPSGMSPERQRRRLVATLVEWVLGSARTPLVMAIEDLHWVDPSTLELIQLLVEQGATAPLLLLYTARPEFRAPWPPRAHHTQITLNRLGARDILSIIAQVAASKALSDDTMRAVVERTGGVPLFVEELTRSLLEGGSAGQIGHEIPATLHDSLMARLDRLGPAKEIIQIGAVIGSEFSYELLQAVHPIAEVNLQQALSRLAEAELLYVRGIAPAATYQFKHALIRDAAYEALLKSRRKELHLIVARTIDKKFPDLKENHPEVLARHWTEAGEPESAIVAWERAGQQAIARGAYREGEQHYRDALAILKALPESPDQDGRELKLQLALGEVMGSTRVWSAVDTAAVYARARILAEQAGSAESLQVFRGLWASALTRGDHRAALILADQMFEIARGIGGPLLVTAHQAQGFSLLCLGDLSAARSHFLQAIEHYREEDFRGIPDHGGVNTLAWAGFNEWLLGYPDQALRFADDARALACRLKNPFAIAYADAVGLFIDGWRGNFGRMRTAAQEEERLGTELGFPLFSAGGKFWDAWGRVRQGELSGAVGSMLEARAELDAFKFYLHRAYNLSLIAEAQALAGAINDAIITVEQAVEANPDELYSWVLALQMRGELRLRNEASGAPRVQLAEQDFRVAVEIARKVSAKSLELRATMSLVRLLASRGRRDEARTILAEIYGWFTEGFGTADLKEAKVLLDELGT